MNIDWNQPLEKLPKTLLFDDLPPLAKDLVRRNVELRRKANDLSRQLEHFMPKDPNDHINVDFLIAENARLKSTTMKLESKLENFRGMLARRDQKIEKLIAKHRK